MVEDKFPPTYDVAVNMRHKPHEFKSSPCPRQTQMKISTTKPKQLHRKTRPMVKVKANDSSQEIKSDHTRLAEECRDKEVLTEPSNTFPELDASLMPETTVSMLQQMNAKVMAKIREQQLLMERMKSEKQAMASEVRELEADSKQQLQMISVLNNSLLASQKGKTSESSKQRSQSERETICSTAVDEYAKVNLKLQKMSEEKKDSRSLAEWKFEELSKQAIELEERIEVQEASLREKEEQIKDETLRQNASTWQHDSTVRADPWKDIEPLNFSNILKSTSDKTGGESLDASICTEITKSLSENSSLSTEEWKTNIQTAVGKLGRLHDGFKMMAGIFQHIACESRFTDLISAITEEAKRLVDAEYANLLVVEEVEREFWCRTKVPGKHIETTTRFSFPTVDPAFSRVPVDTMERTLRDHANDLPLPPPGIATYVAATGNALLIPFCNMTHHVLYSREQSSTDRLIEVTHTSMVLVPLYNNNSPNPTAVLQIFGKNTREGEFTIEDKTLLTGLSNFCGPLLAKTEYYTNVEKNKEQEEILLNLARKIFNCLKLNLLSELVMKQAKHLLNADRCTLFIAGNPMEGCQNERMLYAWQTDVNLGMEDTPKVMTIKVPFGVGIAGTAAEKGVVVNVADAYTDPRFNRKIDSETNYRTKSVLALPVLSSRNTVLGVLQMINKAGGASFSRKDEELMSAIASLLALAIENSRLFYKAKEMCNSLGLTIKHADIPLAIEEICASSRDIIGVENATVYLIDQEDNQLYTYDKKTRAKVIIDQRLLEKSIVGMSLTSKKNIAINDVPNCYFYNDKIDNLDSKTPQHILVAPLVEYGKKKEVVRIIGLLHLLNKTGFGTGFEVDDLFVSIMASQSSSIILSILEKKKLIVVQDATKSLLETCTSFYQELSFEGLMNAVNKACVKLFGVQRGSLFIWDANHLNLWSTKSLQRPSGTTKMNVVEPEKRGGRRRRLSLAPAQKYIIPGSQGLIADVIDTKKTIIVTKWTSTEANEDGERVATYADQAAQFKGNVVIAIPIYDSYGLEAIGVLSLVASYEYRVQDSDLAILPLLAHQISTALDACEDISIHLQRCQRMQRALGNRDVNTDMSFTIDADQKLVASSYPISILSYKHNPANALSLDAIKARILQIPMDDVGDRHVVVLTTATVEFQKSNPYETWLGLGVIPMERLKMDITNAFVQKHAIAVVHYSPFDRKDSAKPISLRNALRSAFSYNVERERQARPDVSLAVASALWHFIGDDLKVDMNRVLAVYKQVDSVDSGVVGTSKFITCGKQLGIQLADEDWKELCEQFKGPKPSTVAYRSLYKELCPSFVEHKSFDYEIFPIIDPVTHDVTSAQVLVHPSNGGK